MTGHSELDDVRIELASIQDQLLALTEDEREERARLHARQEELRGTVRRILSHEPDALSVDQIRRELEHIDQRISEVRGLHLDHNSESHTDRAPLEEQRRKLRERLAVLEGSG